MRQCGRAAAAGVHAAAAVVIAAGLLFMGGASAGVAATVQLTAREFSYEPKDVTAPAGDVVFVVKNAGEIEHNLAIDDQHQHRLAGIAIIEPTQTLQVTLALPPGTYSIYCSLPGHKEAGMVATLRVR